MVHATLEIAVAGVLLGALARPLAHLAQDIQLLTAVVDSLTELKHALRRLFREK